MAVAGHAVSKAIVACTPVVPEENSTAPSESSPRRRPVDWPGTSVACVMAGVTSPEQVRRNAATAEAAPLSAELYAEATRVGRGG